MKAGTKVCYIHIDTEEDKETGYYPPVGTIGTVMHVDGNAIFVKWNSGTIGNGEWWCDTEDVEEVDTPYCINGEVYSREEIWNVIHELSDIRAGYVLFDEEERSKYHACSIAIKALREVIGED